MLGYVLGNMEAARLMRVIYVGSNWPLHHRARLRPKVEVMGGGRIRSCHTAFRMSTAFR